MVDSSQIGFEDLYNSFIFNSSSGDINANVIIVNSDLVLNYLLKYQLLGLDSLKNVIGYTLGNGQIIIGSNNASPAIGNITGTSGQIIITNGPNTINIGIDPTYGVLTVIPPINAIDNNGIIISGNNVQLEFATGSRPGILSAGTQTISGLKTMTLNDQTVFQDNIDNTKQFLFELGGNTTGTELVMNTNQTTSQIINIPNITSTDTFATLNSGNVFTSGSNKFPNLSITNTGSQISFGTTKLITMDFNAPASSRRYQIPDTGANSAFILSDSLSSQTINNGLNLNGAIQFGFYSSNGALLLDGSSNLISANLTDGQLLIGKTGFRPQIGSLTATTNQTTITNGAGSISIGTVQDINTISSPTFAKINLTNTSNQITLGTTNILTLNWSGAHSLTYTIPDATTNCNFILSAGTNNFSGTDNFLGTINIANGPPASLKFTPGNTGNNIQIQCASPSSNRIQTLQDAGDIFVYQNTYDILQNKRYYNSTLMVCNNTYSTGTISQVSPSLTITGTGVTWDKTMVGGIILLTVGSTPVELQITGFTNSTNLIVNRTGTITNNTYTMYYQGTTIDYADGSSYFIDQGGFTLRNNADGTKKMQFVLTSQSTQTTLSMESNQSTSQTCNIPNITSTDTLATLGLPQTFTGNNTFSGLNTFSHDLVYSSEPASSVLWLNSLNVLKSSQLTNGQIQIGSTGSDPVSSTITAGNQVSITNGAGSISVGVVTIPTFSGIILGTGTTLDTFTTTSFSTTWAFGSATSGSTTIYLMREGNSSAHGSRITVQMEVDISTTVSGTTTVITTNTAMAAAYRPQATIFTQPFVKSGAGSITIGYCEIDTGGIINMYDTTTKLVNWSTSPGTTIYRFSFSYLT